MNDLDASIRSFKFQKKTKPKSQIPKKEKRYKHRGNKHKVMKTPKQVLDTKIDSRVEVINL